MAQECMEEEIQQFCNGDGAELEYPHYICPVCGFHYCDACFRRIIMAETGCPNCLSPILL